MPRDSDDTPHLFPHFQPIRKRVFLDSSDTRFTGFAFVELSPTHLRWWWEHEDTDVHEIALADVVRGYFDCAVSEMDERVQIATAHFAAAQRLMERVARVASHDPHIRRLLAHPTERKHEGHT